MEVGALLFLRTIFISEIIEIFVGPEFIVTANVDDVLMIGITADEMSLRLFLYRTDRDLGFLPWAVFLLLHQVLIAFVGGPN